VTLCKIDVTAKNIPDVLGITENIDFNVLVVVEDVSNEADGFNKIFGASTENIHMMVQIFKEAIDSIEKQLGDGDQNSVSHLDSHLLS
jgi:hypothetical protein